MDTSTAVNAVNYLTGARTNYSVLTVQDTSVIVNNLQTVAKQPDPNYTANTRATLVLTDTAVSSTYSVTIKCWRWCIRSDIYYNYWYNYNI